MRAIERGLAVFLFAAYLAGANGCADDVGDTPEPGNLGGGGHAGSGGKVDGSAGAGPAIPRGGAGFAGAPSAGGNDWSGAAGSAGNEGGSSCGNAGQTSGGAGLAGGSGEGGTGGSREDGTGGDGGTGTSGQGGGQGLGGEGGESPVEEPLTWIRDCSAPLALSGDARSVVTATGVWRAETGWLGLPDLPGGQISNTPLAIDRDGLILVGHSGSALGDELYRWQLSKSPQALGVLYVPNSAVAVSADGGTVVGWRSAVGLSHPVPFLWNEVTGARDLDPSARCGAVPPVPGTTNYASYLSLDGSTAVFSSGRGVCHWTASGGMQVADSDQVATALSGDGSVRAEITPSGPNWLGTIGGTQLDCVHIPVVNELPVRPRCASAQVSLTDLDFTGSSGVGLDRDIYIQQGPEVVPAYAVYWSAAKGTRSLTTRLAEQGLCVPVLATSAFLSDDGQTVLGEGQIGCFLARLSEEVVPEQPPGLGYGCTNCGGTRLQTSNVTCSLRMDGGVSCWSGRQRTPTKVPNVSSAVEVATNTYAACARLADGTVTCWAAPGGIFPTPPPVSLTAVRRIASGAAHFCALLEDETIACWGGGGMGQLGNGAYQDSDIPVSVGLTSVVEVAAGGAHTCAIRRNGDVWCWGSDYGPALTRVGSLPTAVQLAVGTENVDPGDCALLASGVVVCWNRVERVFREISSLSNVSQLSAGIGHVCALRNDRSVWCWGRNGWGQTGAPPSDWQATPVQVQGLDGVLQISAGYWQSCALLEDTTIKCWGAEFGIGDSSTCFGDPPARFTPVSVAPTQNP